MGDVLIFDIETTGLSPLHDKVTCICFSDAKNHLCFSGEFEGKVIQSFADYVDKNFYDKLVTYNGWSFDIPFLRVRAMVNGVTLPSIFWDDKKICDPYNILARNKTGKQSEFGELFGKSTCGTGLDCLGFYSNGEFAKIEEHCKSDIVVLEEIFNRMVKAGYKG